VSKNRLKLLLSVALLLVIAGLLWLLLRGLGDLVTYFQQGADPASALNIVPNRPPDLHVKLAWLPDDADTGRAMEPYTRRQIEASYLRAWLQWNLSYLKGEPFGLKTYFSGPGLAAASEAVTRTTAAGWRVAQADLTHSLRLHFYSADGSIVSFTDHAANVAQVVRDARGNEVFAGESTAAYDVVMFLDDGNWRMRHWVRLPTEKAAPGPTSESRLKLAVPTAAIAGINYYPQVTPWDQFWPAYDGAVTERDFALARSLGLNVVRVFVPYAEFGGARVRPEMLDRLQDLLDRAQTHGLLVIPTLFDFWGGYDLLHWPDGDRHLEAILGRFADHPAVLAWDLKNEPDKDYARVGRMTVDAWLAHVIQQARTLAPGQPLTIGWSTPEAAPALAEKLDFVSFHFYAPPAELPTRYAALAAAAPDCPLLLGEFGLPTWNSALFPNGHTEAEQAQYYADILRFMRSTANAGTLAWTLYDFADVPASVSGRLPWRRGAESRLGVIRPDGSPKPAAALLAPGAILDVPAVPGWARWTKPFWRTVGVVLAALGLALLLWLRRRGHKPAAALHRPPMARPARPRRKTTWRMIGAIAGLSAALWAAGQRLRTRRRK
jgi:hypothetical protein